MKRTPKDKPVRLIMGFLFLHLLAGGMISCTNNPSDPNKDPVEIPSAIQLIHPFQVTEGVDFPVIVRNTDASPRSDSSLTIQLTTTTTNTDVLLRRGTGTTTLTNVSGDSLLLSVGNQVESVVHVRSNNSADRSYNNVILGGPSVEWNRGDVVRIDGEVVVPVGSELVIQPGVLVRLGNNAILKVEGNLTAIGTPDSVIAFLPATSGQPWGEINCSGGSVQLEWVLASGGGGDDSRAFGHSGSQPVFRCENGSFEARHLFVVDNPGKALGTLSAVVRMDSSVVNRCDTGGEHRFSFVTFENSWFAEFPDASRNPVDDDNDASYFNLPYTNNEESLVRNCVFVRGKDDGIDHNGAHLRVENCVIEDFDHEGVACSNQNRATIVNTLVLRCGQGIEAGYGAPEVIVDHCAVLWNGNGFRLGDEYVNQQHNGTMTVTNSLSMWNHVHNVYDYDPATDQATELVAISYSMVDDVQFDGIDNNLPGQAVLSEGYLLDETSPGISSATDGLDIGLLP